MRAVHQRIGQLSPGLASRRMAREIVSSVHNGDREPEQDEPHDQRDRPVRKADSRKHDVRHLHETEAERSVNRGDPEHLSPSQLGDQLDDPPPIVVRHAGQ